MAMRSSIRSPSRRVEARAALHKKAEDLSIRLSLVYTQLNALLPVSLLPPELLSRIFRHIQDDANDRETSPLLGWATVTHVCRQWRQVALEDASLWGKIEGRVWHNRKWFPELLARSKQAPINFNHYSRPSGEVISMLSQHLFRIRALSLCGREYQPQLEGLLRSKAPILEELALESDEYGGSSLGGSAMSEPFKLFDGQAPKLRKIHLDLFCIPWIRFPKLRLTYLEVTARADRHYFGTQDSLDQLISFLSENGQDLEVLKLHRCLHPSIPQVTQTRTIELPCLRSLHLRDSSFCIAHLFNLLAIPSSPNCTCTSSLQAVGLKSHSGLPLPLPSSRVSQLQA
ncbi:hypothetical protein BC834DRAFT_970438 [Gloeopeniophorella convolvens]|nr:hypothetical protein BC834DRAFT_970438 [Gloeopeniophorella convolvens]